MISRLLLLAVLLVVPIGCGRSAPEALAEARLALTETRYDDALDEARTGLGLAPDELQRWGLELVVLEALARGGQGEAAAEQLERVEALRPDALPATQYSATADQLRAAGDGPGAIQVLDLGLQRFPEDVALASLISSAKQAPSVDSEELELLRTLGYLE